MKSVNQSSNQFKVAGLKRLTLIIIMAAISIMVWAQTSLKITIIGDSTVCNYASSKYPQAGWGQVIGQFFKTGTVTINNKAIGGRSTRSFYQEGRWAEIVSTLQSGEYVFIQFGHNDRDYSKAERYTDTTQYKEYLRKYVQESRAKGAIPVLISPMNMNAWNGNNVREVFREGANNYRGAMINVANELNVPFIDLEKKSVELQKRLGATYCAKFIYLGLDAGEYPNFPDGSSDGTHFQEMGANFMAKFVCSGISELQSNPDMARLAALLKPLFKVNVLSNKANTGMITESGNTFPEGVSITVKVKPNSGEKFLGWADQSGKTVTTETRYTFQMSNSEISYTALFQGGTQMYSLSTSVTSGEGTISPANGAFASGANVTLTATPKEGFIFDHWGGDLSGNSNPAVLTMNSNKTVSAFFIADNKTYYNISTAVSGLGSITQVPSGEKAVEGSQVVFTASAGKGWKFAGWNGDYTGTDAAYTISTLNKNVNLTAQFIPENPYLYEAEDAYIYRGVAESVNAGFSGTGYANVDNQTGSSITIPVYTESAGLKTITITFANGTTSTRSFSISLNGEEIIPSQTFESTGAWTTWKQKEISLTLKQGVNEITFTSNAADGGPNIDKLEISFQTSVSALSKTSFKPAVRFSSGKLEITSLRPGIPVKVGIFDLHGRQILSRTINTSVNSRTVFPVNNFAHGNYMIQITTGENILVSKTCILVY